MLNTRLLKEYKSILEKELKNEDRVLLLNEAMLDHEDVNRLILVEESINIAHKKEKLKQELESESLYELVKIWEKKGFFDDFNSSKVMSAEDFFVVNDKSMNTLSSMAYLSYYLMKSSKNGDNKLRLSDEDELSHRNMFPSYYKSASKNDIGSILINTCFMSTSTYNFYSLSLNKKSVPADLNQMKEELRYTVKTFKKSIDDGDLARFTSIYYSLMIAEQKRAIERLSSLEQTEVSEVSVDISIKGCEDILQKMLKNEKEIKNLIFENI